MKRSEAAIEGIGSKRQARLGPFATTEGGLLGLHRGSRSQSALRRLVALWHPSQINPQLAALDAGRLHRIRP